MLLPLLALMIVVPMNAMTVVTMNGVTLQSYLYLGLGKTTQARGRVPPRQTPDSRQRRRHRITGRLTWSLLHRPCLEALGPNRRSVAKQFTAETRYQLRMLVAGLIYHMIGNRCKVLLQEVPLIRPLTIRRGRRPRWRPWQRRGTAQT